MSFLTVKQVAERLQISVAMVYMLCSRGRLAHVRVGVGRGTIRIGEQALQDYLQGATVGPQESPPPPPPKASSGIKLNA